MRIRYAIDVSGALADSDQGRRLQKDLLKPFTFVLDLRQGTIALFLGSFSSGRC
jgi:hypothetical protein